MSTTCQRDFLALRTWFELSRVKLYRNDLRGNKNRVSGRFELSKVRVTEGKITVNMKEIEGKSILVPVSAWLELARVRVIESQPPGGGFRILKGWRPVLAWPKLFLTPKRDPKIYISNIYFYIFWRATLNETFTAKYDGVLPRTP